LNSSQWMKLKLTEITSPEEVRKIKLDLNKLEETINTLNSSIEGKEGDINQLQISLNSIRNQEIPSINKVFQNHMLELELLKNENNRIDNQKEDKIKVEEQINLIQEIQNKLIYLTNKIETTRDWENEIRDLQSG